MRRLRSATRQCDAAACTRSGAKSVRTDRSSPVAVRDNVCFSKDCYGLGPGVGRGLGVGANLGVGVGLGVGVAVAVPVAVGVAVAVDVAVAVAVAEGEAVGVGVGVAPPARLNAPIRNRHPMELVVGTYSLMYQKVVSSVGSMSIAV